MTLGYRVAVMRDGTVQQVDTPQTLYRDPLNLFVAAFIGSPSMNLVEAEVAGDALEFAGFRIPLARIGAPSVWSRAPSSSGSGRRTSRTRRSADGRTAADRRRRASWSRSSARRRTSSSRSRRRRWTRTRSGRRATTASGRRCSRPTAARSSRPGGGESRSGRATVSRSPSIPPAPLLRPGDGRQPPGHHRVGSGRLDADAGHDTVNGESTTGGPRFFAVRTPNPGRTTHR